MSFSSSSSSAAAAIKFLNPHAEVSRRGLALHSNINAAGGLEDVLRSNLGPRGTIKMLVSGSGDIKLTKDGAVLLQEMQITNPTARLIARVATAQDDEVGDGTTTVVLLVGELLRRAERHLAEGVHPRHLVDGMEAARAELVDRYLDEAKIRAGGGNGDGAVDREQLVSVARCVLGTKVNDELARQFAEMVTEAVLTIRRVGGNGDGGDDEQQQQQQQQQHREPIDLFMVETMTMESRLSTDSRLVRGLVLDHGTRHPDMPKTVHDAYILTCNVSLEYEKAEVSSGFFYSTAEQRERMVTAERAVVQLNVEKVLALKRQVCDGDGDGGGGKSFVVINQKGISPDALDLLARNGVMALRRAKRRNMERLTLACGGTAVTSLDDLTPDVLGFAGSVYEQTLGDDKYTFVEQVRNPFSCTILIHGPNKHTIQQIKDAVRDGLRGVKNAIEEAQLLPGAGAFECGAHTHLTQRFLRSVHGRARLGVQTFADALLVVPKTLAENSGLDAQDVILKLLAAHERRRDGDVLVGLDVHSGECVDPAAAGVYDGFRAKRQALGLATVIATQLLLVDEMLRAGKDMSARNGGGGGK